MQNYDMDQIRYHTDKIRYMSSKCGFVLKGVDYVGRLIQQTVEELKRKRAFTKVESQLWTLTLFVG